MRRAISILVTTLLAVSVAGTIVVWTEGSSKERLQIVHGVIGAEQKGFFADLGVKAAFARRGLDVRVESAASGDLATTADRSQHDFVFGAATPALQQIRSARGVTTTYTPFFSPIAVATSARTAQVLERVGVAQDHRGWWTLDMKGFLDLAARHVRWNELPGNSSDPATGSVLITSTDVTTSNGAGMYASIASYVANRDTVLASPASVDEVVNRVSPLFLEQEQTEQSTNALFHEFLSKGADTTTMVMISEAPFVARAAASDGDIGRNTVLMYPEPDVMSKDTLVPLSAVGGTVGRLLTDDPGLQQLAVEHGFRIRSQPTAFRSFVQRNKIAVPRNVRDVIEPPADDILDALMTRIDAALHVKLGPRPGSAASNQ
jgi:hypothetical protein